MEHNIYSQILTILYFTGLYTISQLRGLVERTTRQKLDELQFQQKEGKVVEECRHGRQLTLQDSEIKKEDTVFLMKVWFVLNITDPQVM